MWTKFSCALVAGALSLMLSAGAQAKGDLSKHSVKHRISEYDDKTQALEAATRDPKHANAVEALRSLADVLEAIPEKPERVTMSIGVIRANADQIESSSRRAAHSDMMKSALSSAIDAIAALKVDPYPENEKLVREIAAARAAIDGINSKRPALRQHGKIVSAFREVGDALSALEMEEPQLVGGRDEETPPVVEPPPPEPVIPEPAPQATTVIVPPAQTMIVTAPPAPEQRGWFSRQLALSLGGGVANFADNTLENATQVGGSWDVRLIMGARSPIGFELGYVGTANQLNGTMPNVDPNAVILGNGFEGDVRIGTPGTRFPLQVFGFVGAGYNNFRLVGEEFNGSIIPNSDDTFVLPAGGGLQLNLTNALMLDARFTYRAIFDENLIQRNNADMYTATGRLGYVF